MRVAKVRKQMRSCVIRMSALFVLTLLFTSGCATGGNFMTKAERISRPEQGKALVTFVRASGFDSAGGPILAFILWDSDNLVGVLGPGSCIQYQTVPGEHYFLARAENWSCVKADLAANMHYVIKTNTFMGAWRARVAFDPVTKSDYERAGQLKDVRKWLAKAQPMMPDPQMLEAYTQPRRQQVLEARATFEAGKGNYETLARQDYLPE